MKKRFLAVLLCMILVLAALPTGVFAANETNTLGITFSVEDPAALTESSADQEVTVELKPSESVVVNGVSYVVNFPEGWSVKSITCSNPDINITDDDINYELTATSAKLSWSQASLNNKTTDTLGTITIVVPGGTEKGTYNLSITKMLFSHYNDANKLVKWENGATADFTVTIEELVVPTATVPTAATGLEYNGSVQTGVPAGEGYTITGNTATDAGTYTATATLAEGYVWDDGTTEPKTIEWSIGKKVIDAPAAATGLEYNGSEQTGVPEGEGYTVTGNTATNAGEYSATVTADNNHTFADGESVTVDWEIARKLIDAPKAEEGLVYNGSEQTGVPEGEGYTITGNKGTDADTYTATATADDNHIFADEQTSVDVDWEIEQAELEDGKLDLAVGESKDLEALDGVDYELGDDAEGVIELDENGKVTAVGEGTATIIVTSNGEGNYGRGQATITVTVTKTPPTGDMTGRYIMIGCAALVVLAAYLFITKRKEQE